MDGEAPAEVEEVVIHHGGTESTELEQDKPKREIVLDTDRSSAFGAVLAFLFATLGLLSGIWRLIQGVPLQRPFSWWTLGVDAFIVCSIPYFARQLWREQDRIAMFAVGLFCGVVLTEMANMFIASWGLSVGGALALLAVWILTLIWIVNWFRSKRVTSV